MASVRFGLFVPQGWILDLIDIKDPIEQYEAMSRVTKTAERLGFDSIWLFDHFHTYYKPVLETTFECWTSIARWPEIPAASGSGRWSPATATGTRRCWPR